MCKDCIIDFRFVMTGDENQQTAASTASTVPGMWIEAHPSEARHWPAPMEGPGRSASSGVSRKYHQEYIISLIPHSPFALTSLLLDSLIPVQRLLVLFFRFSQENPPTWLLASLLSTGPCTGTSSSLPTPKRKVSKPPAAK